MRNFIGMITVLFSAAFIYGAGFVVGMFSMEYNSYMEYNSENEKIEYTTSVRPVVYRTDRKSNPDNILYKMYKIKKGDSIYGISQKFLVLPWQLRAANRFSKDVVLHPGQEIKIPIIDWAMKSYEGRASWYGPRFHGKKMANGKIYNQNNVLIAHRTLPLGMKVRITNLENGKSLVARVLDRGPYTKINGKYDREVDLSFAAAKILGSVKAGIIPVRIRPLS